MNIVETVDELWLDAAQQILVGGSDVPSRDGNCREVLGFVGRVSNPYANFMFNPVRKMSPSYAGAEFLWYLSGEQRIDRIVPYAPQYERFATEVESQSKDEKMLVALGAYGYRWANGDCWQSTHYFNQIHHLVELFRRKPETRQAVITMYQAKDLFRAETMSKDLPCTLSLNFILRNGHLNLVCTMRSNDIWLGLPYDMFCFTSLQIFLAHCMNVEVGFYQHQAMSMHVYERNMEKFAAAANPPVFATGPMEYKRYPDPRVELLTTKVQTALELEVWNRERSVVAYEVESRLGEGSLLAEMCLLAASKWDFTGVQLQKRSCSKLMREYMKEHFPKE